MNGNHTVVWIVRLSWPVLGGVWGAWLGFGGYFRLARNADSFAMLFALGLYIVFACLGLAAGSVLGATVGGLVEWILWQVGMPIAGALCVATVVNVVVLWQVVGLVQTAYPGLRSEGVQSTLSATAIPAMYRYP